MTMSMQEISDRLEIQDLMLRYSYAIDSRDWDALDHVFGVFHRRPRAAPAVVFLAGGRGHENVLCGVACGKGCQPCRGQWHGRRNGKTSFLQHPLCALS